MWSRLLRVLTITVLVLVAAYIGLGLLVVTRPERFPPGPPVMSTHWETTAILTRTAPVAVRAVRVEVEPTKGRLRTPDLNLGVRGTTGLDDPKAPPVWISIFDAATGKSTPNPAGTGHATLDGWIGSGHGFDECQATRCAVTYLLVARWEAPLDGPGVPLTFFADLKATLDVPTSWAFPSGPTPTPVLQGLSLATDDGFRFDGDPGRRTVSTSGSFRITSGSPPAPQRLLLHVPAAVLGDTLRYPVLGRALLTVDRADASSRPAAPWIEITGPNGTTRALAGIALDIDWLAGCQPGRDCEVPITVGGAFEQPVPRVTPTPPPDAWSAADWTLTVRLERMESGAPPPGEGMWLEEVTQ
jgi:hypothetical protein